jgi:hypothetical protein
MLVTHLFVQTEIEAKAAEMRGVTGDLLGYASCLRDPANKLTFGMHYGTKSV